jgi:hypothetical protein
MKFLDTLRAGPPPPKIALLPDALFFTRAVPITAGATPAEAAAQIELALEGISPFPLAQLFYGWFWAPGAKHALVFAAYRRRFTTEQTSTWSAAELVLPAFAALLGGKVEPGTTLLLASPEGLTAVHWGAAAVPEKVLFQPFPPDATDEQRAHTRAELIRAIGGSKVVLDLTSAPTADPSLNDREVVFRSGEFVSRVPATVVSALDVRDKGELASLRAARNRDVVLWRVAVGLAAALALLAVGEIARLGGLQWQKVRLAQVAAQRPRVESIMASNALATRIEDLATKRLLPMEMLSILLGGKESSLLPPGMAFTRVVADSAKGLYTLTVDAQTNNAGQVSVYETALKKLPACEDVNVQVQGTRGELTTFRLTVKFRPDAVKPTSA